MANSPDLEHGDELTPVTKETSRGGQEPPPEINDRPEQNIAYDEAVKAGRLRQRNVTAQKGKARYRSE